MKFGVVILAAGASRRMGRPKLLLLWKDTTVIGHLINQWTELGAAQISVVLPGDNEALKPELDRLKFAKENRITNPQPERGMFSSVQCAAGWSGWNSSLTHFIITLGDQPHLKSETLCSLIKFSEKQNEKICQPALLRRPKHPVILPKPIFEKLGGSKVETLAQFLKLQSEDISLMRSPDPGLNLDLDTPEDYVSAKKLAS